jgi:hypothetical protein
MSAIPITQNTLFYGDNLPIPAHGTFKQAQRITKAPGVQGALDL